VRSDAAVYLNIKREVVHIVMADIIYVTGGARSGKSSFALSCAERYGRRAFLATAEPFDGEMVSRIEKHQAERGDGFLTVEEPLDVAQALEDIGPEVDVVLLDCLTVWTGNLMHHVQDDAKIEQAVDKLLAVLRDPPCSIVLVSNEVGMGIVPENAMARAFRDMAGMINQRVAAVATEAWLLCSGLPVRLK